MIEAEIKKAIKTKAEHERRRESSKSLDFLTLSNDAIFIYDCCSKNCARLFNFACSNAFQLW
jgi:hypothetical protein